MERENNLSIPEWPMIDEELDPLTFLDALRSEYGLPCADELYGASKYIKYQNDDIYGVDIVEWNDGTNRFSIQWGSDITKGPFEMTYPFYALDHGVFLITPQALMDKNKDYPSIPGVWIDRSEENMQIIRGLARCVQEIVTRGFDFNPTTYESLFAKLAILREPLKSVSACAMAEIAERQARLRGEYNTGDVYDKEEEWAELVLGTSGLRKWMNMVTIYKRRYQQKKQQNANEK